MTATGTRRKRSGARRNDRPQPCQRCRVPIVWGIVEEADGSLRHRRDDPNRLAFVPLNATPSPRGEYEYLRGPVGRPVVRELDDPERLARSEAVRYSRHLDTVREER